MTRQEGVDLEKPGKLLINPYTYHIYKQSLMCCSSWGRFKNTRCTYNQALRVPGDLKNFYSLEKKCII